MKLEEMRELIGSLQYPRNRGKEIELFYDTAQGDHSYTVSSTYRFRIRVFECEKIALWQLLLRRATNVETFPEEVRLTSSSVSEIVRSIQEIAPNLGRITSSQRLDEFGMDIIQS